MSRKKIIAGNWKMNMTPSEAVKLVETLKPLVANDDVDVVFCVPAIDILPVVEAAKGSNIQVGVSFLPVRLSDPCLWYGPNGRLDRNVHRLDCPRYYFQPAA